MAASTDLVTAAEVKTYLGISGSTHDTLIDELIDIVSEAIEDYCGTFFSATSTSEKLDGGEFELLVKRPPIGSIISITDNLDSSTVSASSYDFYATEGMIYVDDSSLILPPRGRWAIGNQRYTVLYVAGHTAVPEAVKLVAYMAIGRHLKALPSSNNKGRWTQPEILHQVRSNEARERDRAYKVGFFTPEEQALLARYRHRRV